MPLYDLTTLQSRLLEKKGEKDERLLIFLRIYQPDCGLWLRLELDVRVILLLLA